MVETTGLELPTLVLPCVKGCGIQISAKESETFHVTSCPIFMHAVPRQRETEGEKNSRTGRNQGPGPMERPGFYYAFFAARRVMTAAWAMVQNAPGLDPSVMPLALAS